MSQILKVSVSKAKTFSDCKKKFKYSYVLKLPKKDRDYLVLGSFCHKVLEVFHKSYMDGSKLAFHEAMNIAYRSGLEEYSKKMTKEIKAECWEIINNYLKLISKNENKNIIQKVIGCEKGFELLIDGNILLNGSIDRIQVDDDNVVHVCDYKTTKNTKYLKNDYFQLLTYAYVLLSSNHSLDKIRASYVLLRHNFEYITKEFSREEILQVKDKICDYADKMIKESSFEANPSPLCNYCDFVDICEEGQSNLNYKLKFGEVSWE